MRSLALSLLLLTFLYSCKQEKDKPEIISDKSPQKILKTLDNPSNSISKLPRLFSNGKELYFSWVTQKDSVDILSYSIYSNNEWLDETEVISGEDWFTNWADFPAIAANGGNILTNILQKSDSGTYTYDVKLNLYRADIHATQKNFILHDDGTKSEHGFVSMLPWGKDSFFVTWLDGRNTAGGHGDHNNKHGEGGAMTLRGAFVNGEGIITDDLELDARVCDCCQTSAALTENGPVVVYRDRSMEEIRDISIVRYIEGKWTPSKTIGNDNWKIAGCPVNGPTVDAFQDAVGVAWFTVAEDEGNVKVAFSQNNGETFGEAVRIDTGNATGRVDLVMLSKTTAAIIWMEPQGDDEVIQLMKVSSDGTKGNVLTISKTSAERASGFPQLEILENKMYMAWTVLGADGISSINTASIELADVLNN